MNKIKWGILGCGSVTEVKSGPAFNLVDNSQLVAVMRRNAQKAADYAKRHNVSKWFSNADELINDPDVNAIYIATPPNAHAELSLKALKAGKPVYVEKPMALNYAQCQNMVKASEQYKTPLFVAYYRRSLPGFKKVKELVDTGAIGPIKIINIQLYKPLSKNEISGNLPWRVQPDISGGGHFVDLASHQLDYLDFLFGSVKEIVSIAINQTGKYDAEDIVTAGFLFNDDIIANCSWCFSVPDYLQRDSIEIIGTKGSIEFTCFNFTPIKLITSKGTQTFDYPRPKHVQYYLIQEVVNALLGKGKAPTEGNIAARTSWVMDEVLKEYYKNIN